jgi:murein DD-endopeptidase MepM/ murein hydrolase activator NlpD
MRYQIRIASLLCLAAIPAAAQAQPPQSTSASARGAMTGPPRPGGKWLWPLADFGHGSVSQDYAEYGGYVENKHHTGFDIGTSGSHPAIMAVADGSVKKFVPNGPNGCGSCTDHGYGNSIAIQHANKLYSFFAHMDHLDSGLLSRIEAQCVERTGRDKFGATKDEWDCARDAVQVRRGDIVGYVGNTNFGNTGPQTKLAVHLHFEAKRFPTLESPEDPTAFGYSADHPHLDRWEDPVGYLEASQPIKEPYQVTITQAGDGISLRLGPQSDYPSALNATAGSTFWAHNESNISTVGCSGGWYKLKNTPEFSNDPNTYFVSTKGFSRLPDVWVCRENNGTQYVAP